MLWVTRSRIRVNRTATAWLVRRFVDPDATFCFVEPSEVARTQSEHGAIGFDAPGARYPHKDASGRCSFEALVEEYRPVDGALRKLARIVHVADFPDEIGVRRARGSSPRTNAFDAISLAPRSRAVGTEHDTPAAPEAVGLRAISRGFPLITADDHETLERSAFLYDALY